MRLNQVRDSDYIVAERTFIARRSANPAAVPGPLQREARPRPGTAWGLPVSPPSRGHEKRFHLAPTFPHLAKEGDVGYPKVSIFCARDLGYPQGSAFPRFEKPRSVGQPQFGWANRRPDHPAEPRVQRKKPRVWLWAALGKRWLATWSRCSGCRSVSFL